MYNKLVLSGGAKRGILLLGSLEYMYEKRGGDMEGITEYIGTSIGGIICYLLIIGYKPSKLLSYLITKDFFNKFKDANLVGLTKGDGAFDWGVLRGYLEDLTMTRCGRLFSMRELYEEFGKKLVCVTYNFTKQEEEKVSYEDYGDVSCMDVLNMTSNIPLYFDRFMYDDNYYIDGGIINNFPIDVYKEGDKILAINVSKMYVNDSDKITTYMLNMCTSVIINNVKRNLRYYRDTEGIDIVNIEGKDIKTVELNVNINEVFRIFSYGYSFIKLFLDGQ
jgi:NTE family protein